MNLRKALHLTSHILTLEQINDAPIEAEILLCYSLGISKTQLFAEPERILTSTEINRLWYSIQRRLLHKPTAYISKSCSFYDIDLYIDHRAFIPRPETELLVEEAIEFAHHHSSSEDKFTVADIGTGSGAIAISLALALPQAKIFATDISASALQVAEINCRRYRVDGHVILLQGDLLEPLPEPVDIITANLPYIKNCELKTLNLEITNFEPLIALVGGDDGLEKIRSLLDQIPGKIHPEGCLFLEIGQGQGEIVKPSIYNRFPEAMINLIPDLGGVERVVKVSI